MTLRKPLYSPRCGDIWRLCDGRCFVVDYVGTLATGITFRDGDRQAGFQYTSRMSKWIKDSGGQLISTFEEAPLSWNCDDRGWTKEISKKEPSREQSVSFLVEVVQEANRQAFLLHTIPDIKAWRERETDAGRPAMLHSFFKVLDVCRVCRGSGFGFEGSPCATCAGVGRWTEKR